MISRLANVLYWIACIIAGLTAALGLLIFLMDTSARKDGWVVMTALLVVAFVIWLGGIALRYILSGEKITAPALAGGPPAREDLYAERLYEALPLSNELGDMTPEKLRVPQAAVPRFLENLC